MQWETAQLASLLSLLNVIPPTSGAEVAGSLPGINRGERLCYAFETYRTAIPDAHISFEHAVFLATALTRGDQLRIGGCAECGGLVVLERFPIRERRCYRCTHSTSTH